MAVVPENAMRLQNQQDTVRLRYMEELPAERVFADHSCGQLQQKLLQLCILRSRSD
jgi:hypothetical protein